MNKLRIDSKTVRDRSLASESAVSAKSLRSLSKSTDVEVRRLVATHISTPIEVLNRLALDPDGSVRAHVGLNPSTPHQLSLKISNDSNLDTQLYLAEKFALHQEILEALQEHNNPFVRGQATRSLDGIALEQLLASTRFRCVKDTDYYLGELLRAANLANETTLMRLLDTGTRLGQKFGQVLIRTRTLDVPTVALALHLQMVLRTGGTRLDDAILYLRKSTFKRY